MKFIQYLRYFFLSLNNRGIIFTCKLLYFEPYYEKKLGIKTLAIENLEGMDVLDNDFLNNHHYQGASYYVLHHIFDALKKLSKANSFIDYGCGKARAMIVAAEKQFTLVKGIDLAAELCEASRKNIELVKNKFPQTTFEVAHANATTFENIDDIDVFYFFNPFGRQVMVPVIARMKESKMRKPRTLYVIYVNPQFYDCFIHEHFEICYEMRSKRYTEAMILKLVE